MARMSGGPGGTSHKYHTTKRNRNPSRYPERLEGRGLVKTPAMPALDTLRRRQTTDTWRKEHPCIVANLAAFGKRGLHE